MKYTFVKFDDNYSDEFDCEGFRVFEEGKWEEFVATFPEHNLRFGFGTNEEMNWQTKEQFLKSFNITPIDDQIVNTLIDLFGHDVVIKHGFGMFPYEYDPEYDW